MADPSDTYTVEVLGFPSLTPDEALDAYAAALDLPRTRVEDRLKSYPALVKVNVPGAGAAMIARALVKAGADVRLTHEPTGTTKTLEARAAGASAASLPAAPSSVVPPPGAAVPEPPAPRIVPPDVPADPTIAAEARCPSCGGPLALGGAGKSSGGGAKVASAVVAVLSAGAGWILSQRYGFRASVAFVCALVAVTTAALAPFVRWKCERCSRSPAPGRLAAGDRARVRSRRLVLVAAGAVFAALALILSWHLIRTPRMTHTSKAGRWTAVLPRTHWEVEHELIEVPTPFGVVRADAYAAINDNTRIGLFALYHFRLPAAVAASPDLDGDALVRGALEGAVKNVGCELGDVADADAAGGHGMGATFSGRHQDQPIHGRARVLRYGDELLMQLYAGHEESAVHEPDGRRFFDSLRFEPAAIRDPHPSLRWRRDPARPATSRAG
ncbi:MAG: hypothetical protein HY907_00250 [Deltaproteobacteria bacterium]|nr:hypothetical protein [Deltaproteobacteria bacterium]